MTSSQPSLGDKPSRMPPADLGSAFSAKPRSAGLGGRLAPMKLAPAPPEQAPEPEAAPPEPRPAKPAARSIKAAAAASTGRTEHASSGLQPIVVYVSASIRERLRNGAGDRTFTDVVLMALDATHATLQSRFADQPPPAESMFAGLGRPTSRRHAEPYVQVSLRPLRDDLAVIDRLTAELNAPSRSALVNAALDEYLPRDQ